MSSSLPSNSTTTTTTTTTATTTIDELRKMRDELLGTIEKVKILSTQIEGKIVGSMKELEEKEKQWKDMENMMEENINKLKSKIVLDVGGKKFATSKTTLLSQQNTFFSAMLGSGKWKPDDDGAYFIDRNPKYFAVILEYLRTGKLPATGLNEDQLEGLKCDIDFYQIQVPGLTALTTTTTTDNNKTNVHLLAFDVKGRIGCGLTNNNRTITKTGLDGYQGVFGNLGWNTGNHEWNVKIENIVNSHWFVVGVGRESSSSYSSCWGVSSLNQSYKGNSSQNPSTISGNWKNGDVINVLLNSETHVLKITNKRTGASEEIGGLPSNETLYPFFDIFKSGLSLSFL